MSLANDENADNLETDTSNGRLPLDCRSQSNGAPRPSPRCFNRLPQHDDNLAASGIRPETADAAGITSCADPVKVAKVLNWNYPATQLVPVLGFNYWRADGKRELDYARVRPDHPRERNGKAIKYEAPIGKPNHAYFVPLAHCIAAYADAIIPLVIVEGEKKALAIAQTGKAVIGIGGVDAWSIKRERDANGKKIGERELLPGLAALAWKERPVTICYDSDVSEKPDIHRAEWALVEALKRSGAIVRVARIPHKPGSKVGADDFIVANGEAAFLDLLEKAIDPEPPEDRRAGRVSEADDDPHRLARIVLQNAGESDGVPKLRRYADDWLLYRDGAYRDLPDKEANGIATRIIKVEFDRLNIEAMSQYCDREAAAREKAEAESKEYKASKPPDVHKVSTRLLGDVNNALASEAMLPACIAAPAWLIRFKDDPDPADLLVCRNAIVNLPALVSGQRNHVIDPTPRLFVRNSLDYDFSLNAPAPTSWLQFLTELWPNDPQAIATLQEWFGYLLVSDTRQQKILLIVGPKRSGKGTIARVLRALVGPENCAGPTLAGLTQNFGLQPLLGKSVAIVSDARLTGRSDAAIVIERLLSISGEDALSVPRKYKEDAALKLSTRFVILTNEIPKLNDASGALIGRFIALKLLSSFYGNEDTGLTDRLLNELPGILLWAIAGWQQLRDRGRFCQPTSGRELIDDAERLSSPILAFIADCCEVGPSRQIERSELFRAWQNWAEGQGHTHYGTAASFGRDLAAAVPTITSTQPRDGDSRVRCYVGISRR